MKIQYKKIVQELKKNGNWMTSSELSSLIGVSVRSVKNYISEINFLWKNCIESSHKGYRIKDEEFLFELEENNEIPLENDERICFVTKKLLLLDENIKIYLDDLADEIYVSNAVLYKVLEGVKKLCDEYDIKMNLMNNRLSLVGSEENKRRLMRHLYLAGFGTNKISTQLLQKSFEDYDVSVVREILHETCKKYKYYINGYSFDYLILDTLITLNRIKNNHSSKREYTEELLQNTNEAVLSKEIIDKFQKQFEIEFNSYESASYTSLLISYLMKVDYKTITNEDLIRLFGIRCIKLVDKILKTVNEYYYISLNNYEFYIKFVIHIYNLLYRAETHFVSKNPITETIKRNNPLLFDCGVKIADIIFSETNYIIGEDEIAYIAIHIGAALETEENLNKKIQAILIFPQYYNFHLMLEEKIIRDFENELNIVDVITSVSDLNRKSKKYNLIISAIPIQNIKSRYIVEINSFYTQKDYQKINEVIYKIRRDRKRSTLLEQLISISSPDLFRKNLPIQSKDEALQYISRIMVEEGYCNSNYLEDVYKREVASSTNFGNIAVPHGISMNCNKTGLFIFISEKGVKWDSGIVNILIYLCINKNDTEIFRNVYDNLIVLLLDNKVVTDVLKSHDYYDFINRIINSF